MGGIFFDCKPELCLFMGESSSLSIHLSPLVTGFEETE